MDFGSRRHTRLNDDPWIADRLRTTRDQIIDIFDGRIGECLERLDRVSGTDPNWSSEAARQQ